MRRGTVFASVLLVVALFAPGARAQESDETQESVETELNEQNDSGVGGTANFTFLHPDTRALVKVNGLDPGATARITVHAGGCSSQSASFVALPDVTADADGNATTEGLLLFQGKEAVELDTIADGEHSISVAQGDRTVACGEVTQLGQAAEEPKDDSGDEPPFILIAAVATVVVLLVAVVIAMKRRRKA